jgi:6-phosphogluconolactonase
VSEKRVIVAASRQELAELVADKFIIRVRKSAKRHGSAHIVLTGGSVASEFHRAVATHPDRDTVDWSAVHVWWGDERFVPAGDADRNEGQAESDVLAALALPASNIHRMPAADDGASLAGAAEAYQAELARFAGQNGPWPDFDLAFAGVGPDGHVLSVFPGSPEAALTEETVVGVASSPKPPPKRLTMSVPLVNRSKRVWLIAAGADKSSAVGLALANAHTLEVPAAGLRGTQSTKVFIDADLASGVPDELVERERFWSADDERADYIPNALR